LNSSGTPTASQLYAPYGGIRYSNGAMPTDYGFTGQRADSATGLDYYGARYYDPTLGQFTSADTVLDGLNRYAYVSGNPTTLTDPSGNRACTDACGPAVSSMSPAQWQQFYAVAALTMPGAALTMALWSPDAWHQALAYAFAHPDEMSNGNAYSLYLALGSEAQSYRNSQSADYWNSSPSMMEEGWELTSMMVNSLQAMHAGNGANDSGQNLAMTAFPTLLGPQISDGDGNDIPLSRPLDDGGSPSTDETCSFSVDTPVATPNGQEQAIGTLQVGDQVEAYDPTTGQSSVQTVQHVWVHQDHDLLDVTLISDTTEKAATSVGTHIARAHRVQNRADSDNNDNSDDPDSDANPTTAETVHTTTNHPWLTADRGWLAAGDLRPGEQVIQLDGSLATVAAVRVVSGTATMYNLTVSHLHTFAVGSGAYVVHNTCGPTGPSSGAKTAAPGGGGGGGTPASSGPSPLGRGSTGRQTPSSLGEEYAIGDAMSHPEAGVQIPISKGMTDARWPQSDGWVKMRQDYYLFDGPQGDTHIQIHYVYNTRTGESDDFKFAVP
jgi:RHS repeat-associated protein